MDYNKFIEFWQGVVRQSVYEEGQELIAYAESLQGRDLTLAEQASLSSFYIKFNGANGFIPSQEAIDHAQRVFGERVNRILWANRSDW